MFCRFIYSDKRCFYASRTIKSLFDHHIEGHKWCAYMICLMTYVHVAAHYFNVMYFTESHNSDNGLIQALNNLTDGPGGTSYLNPVRSGSVHYIVTIFQLFGGWTGVVITFALWLMVTTSAEPIRRSFFELFWMTHHLFVVFFVFLVIHGYGRQIRAQVNLSEHDPTNCSELYELWGTIDECPLPIFAGGAPGTWKWVIGPFLLYLLERCLRLYHAQNPSKITKIVFHPSRVIELQMRKPTHSARGNANEVGEYVFINCRKIAKFEWHPFTLTSAPEEDYLSVHIRIAGDWTGDLAEALKPLKNLDISHAPKIGIDGPYGAASQDVFDYEVAVCVGAGIGITPFASLFKSIYYRKRDGIKMKFKKVYFIWICPDMYAFEWFTELIKNLEKQLAQLNEKDLVDIGIYLSRGWDLKLAKVIGFLLHKMELYFNFG